MTLHFGLSCRGFFFSVVVIMAFHTWRIVVSVGDRKGKVEKIVSITNEVTTNRHAIITLVLRHNSWHSVLGNTRHVEAISQNFVASNMADPYCYCEIVYGLGAVCKRKH